MHGETMKFVIILTPKIKVWRFLCWFSCKATEQQHCV